jgi:putative protease
LNALRRQLVSELRRARWQRRPQLRRQRSLPPAGSLRFTEHHLGFADNVLNRQCADFYQRYGVQSHEPAAESGLCLRGQTVMTLRYCILHELHWCPHQGAQPARKEPFYLVDETGRRLCLLVDCSSCTTELRLE